MTENDITYQIRGAIYQVYKALGPGLLEAVYEEALTYELQKRGLKVERQLEVPILYDGKQLNTNLRLDMLVEDKVIIELKSVAEMKDVFYKQTLTYCKLLNKKLGILVNISAKKYYGMWGDDGMTDEDFINELKSMRNFRHDIVEL